MKRRYLIINEDRAHDRYYYPFILLPYTYYKGCMGFTFGRIEVGINTDEESPGRLIKDNKYHCRYGAIDFITVYIPEDSLIFSEDLPTRFIGYNLLLKKYEKKIEKKFNCEIPWEKIGTKR